MVSSTDRQSGSQTNGRKTGASMAAMTNPSISKATARIQKPAYAAAGGAGGGGSGSGSSTNAAYGAATPTATIPVSTGEWRNWQTRRIQVPVSERTWGLNSPLAHSLHPDRTVVLPAHATLADSTGVRSTGGSSRGLLGQERNRARERLAA